ncbi:MAG: hypothetical protein M3Q10_03550 [Chloroflexota bacterium]|nr:hypothetical protein [Chloroflexota bacterium]
MTVPIRPVARKVLARHGIARAAWGFGPAALEVAIAAQERPPGVACRTR